MKDNKIRALIDAKKAGRKMAAIDFVSENPEIPAIISKLVKSDQPVSHDRKGFRQIGDFDTSTMRAASESIGQKAKDADLVMELFPEMELSAQILISSVISPNDMNTTEVNYSIPPTLKVSPIGNLLLGIVKDYFENTYKIEPLLPKILMEMLFGSGSYPVAVIPENSVDNLINGDTPISTESLSAVADKDGVFTSIGILGPAKRPENGNNKNGFSLESLTRHVSYSQRDIDKHITVNSGSKTILIENLTVTDNFNSLKMPLIVNRRRSQTTDEILSAHSTSLEDLQQYLVTSGRGSSTNMTDQQLSDLFYKNTRKINKNIVKVKTDEEVGRSSVGEPLILKMPSEAVIPVYTPGNEEQHIGYFVLLDSEGNPLSRNSTAVNNGELRSMLADSKTDMNSYLLNESARNFKSNCDQVTFTQASKIYADIIEADLLARLRNGIIGGSVQISRNEEIYRIMLARSLMKQQTQLLYVPIKLMTYFALKYNDYGVGVSLLDKMRNLNSLRAMLLFAKTMAQIKNSIGRTKVAIKLDPEDPNPQKSIEMTMHEIARTRQQGMPLGVNTASDLVDWVQRSGLEYSFEGHPGLPDTSIDFSESSTNYSEPSNDLSEDLRKSAIMATGLSPETVDNGFQPDFATTVIANNLLLSKRVKKIQEAFVPQLTDHCQKIAMYNTYIFDAVRDAIKDNLKKITEVKNADPLITQLKDEKEDVLVQLLTLEFLSNFEVTLTQPDTSVLKNLQEALNVYEEVLDKAINYYISTESLPANMVGEQGGENIENIKQIVKAYFMRKWMVDNHVLPELADIGTTDEDGQPILDFGKILSSHINAISKSVVSLLQKTAPVGQAADKDIGNIVGADADSSSSFTSSSSSDTTDEGMGENEGESGLGGLDDFLSNP